MRLTKDESKVVSYIHKNKLIPKDLAKRLLDSKEERSSIIPKTNDSISFNIPGDEEQEILAQYTK